MRDDLKTGAVRPVAGVAPRLNVSAETAYKEPILYRLFARKKLSRSEELFYQTDLRSVK
jgi:hypothetical protein